MSELTDAVLVDRVRELGDQRAYEMLVSRHYGAVYRQACALVGDAIEAQDLAQEAFLSAHTRLQGLRDPASFGGWLHHILHNLAMDWHRSLPQRIARSAHGSAATFAPDGAQIDEVPGGCSTPLELLLRTEHARQLLGAVHELPERYQRVLMLHYFDQLSFEEIAGTLDIPLGTALSLASRARNRLRELLHQYHEMPAALHRLELGLTTLPSRQGWVYLGGYQFLPGAPPETRVYRATGGCLTMDNADLYPDNCSCYLMAGVVHPYCPFVLELRLRKVRESARYPEYCVRARCRHRRNMSFTVAVNTGIEHVKLEIGMDDLLCNEAWLDLPPATGGAFRDYRLEGTPRMGWRLFVDGGLIGAGLPAPGGMANSLVFGDTSPTSGNAHVEIALLRFTQMEPGCTVSSLPVDGEDWVARRPFARLGGTARLVTPRYASEQMCPGAAALRHVIQTRSRRWRLRPGAPIRPVDLAGR